MSKPSSLGSSAARGAGITLASQVFRIGIQFAGIVLLARLLTPTAFGEAAIVLALVSLAEIFRDFGLTQATVQAETVSRAQRDWLFWINALMGLFLAATLFLAAPLVAGFYHRTELIPLFRAMSLFFVGSGLATQYRAQLNREMRFGALALSEVIPSAAGFGSAVVAAFMGAGVWALVTQQLVYAFTLFLSVLFFGRWIPRLPRPGTDLKPFLRFGVNLIGVQILDVTAKNSYVFVLGRVTTTAVLGVFDRAYQLAMMPLNQLNAPASKVALPVLSRLRHDRDRYVKFILQGQTTLVHVTALTFAVLASLTSDIVPIVLGHQWLTAVPYIRVLSVASVAIALQYVEQWVFQSHGMTGSQLRFSLIAQPVLIVMVISGGLIGGAMGVTVALAVTRLIVWPASLLWVRRETGLPFWALFYNGIRALVSYTLCGVAAYFASSMMGPVFVRLVVGLAVFAAVMALLALVWPHYRHDLLTIVQLRRLVVNRSGRTASGSSGVRRGANRASRATPRHVRR